MFLLKKNQAAWRWASKAAIAGLGLALLFFWDAALIIKAVFYIAMTASLFLSQLENREKYKTSFIIIIILSICLAGFALTGGEKTIIFTSFLIILWIIIGLTNLMFADEKRAYEAVILGISLVSGFLIFKNNFSPIPSVLVAFFIFLPIFQESLKIDGLKISALKISSGISALIISEIAFLGLFLPIDPIGYSLLIAASFLTIKNIVKYSFFGRLNIKTTLEQVIIFIAVSILILSLAEWSV